MASCFPTPQSGEQRDGSPGRSGNFVRQFSDKLAKRFLGQPEDPAVSKTSSPRIEAVAKQLGHFRIGPGTSGGGQSAPAVRKRNAIAAEGTADAATISITTIPKSDATLRIMDKATRGNLLFDMLLTPARIAIFNSMVPLHVEAGTDIIQQGQLNATKFYVLEKGNCDVFVSSEGSQFKPVKVLSYGSCSCFGELALLYSAPRAATVRALTDCKLWVMERPVYLAIKRTHADQAAADMRKLLSKVPMLDLLAPERRALVAEAMEVLEFRPGQAVFRQGDIGDRFYLIKSGAAVVSKGQGAEHQTIARLTEGGYFGERALIKSEKRAADVVAEGLLVCYALERTAFNDLLGPIQDVWRFEALRRVPVLFSLSEPQLFELARCMKDQKFAAGQLVFRKGDPGDTFYVISEGSFSVFDNKNQELVRIGKGSCFGELALLRQDVRAANVRAVTEATVLVLSREDFNRHLGALSDLQHMWRFEALSKVPVLTPLTPAQKAQLCPALRPICAPAGTTLVRRGELGDAFYIVQAGCCVIFGEDGKELSRLGAGQYFGELALLRNEARAASVKAITAVDLLALSRADFVRLLGPLQDLLAAHAAKYCPVSSAKQNLALADLKKVAVLGAGAFGQVTLVRHGTKHYALKMLSKAQVLATGLQEHVKQEKQLMASCDCPWMVNLVTSFQDATHLYLLLESVMGGEFYTFLTTRKQHITEEGARFYAASVVLGLEYMNARDLMWRDLKPENLLMDTSGYLKMADFGFARKLASGQKTYTLCGTPEYIAPEIVTHQGHTHAVDWWALGVLLYEICAGRPPFSDADQVSMFDKICSVKYKFPSSFSPELQDLISRLLRKNPAHRLGMQRAGAADIKRHPWFASFDWPTFCKRTMPAPYLPQVGHPEDTHNFAPSASEQQKAFAEVRYTSTGIFKDF